MTLTCGGQKPDESMFAQAWRATKTYIILTSTTHVHNYSHRIQQYKSLLLNLCWVGTSLNIVMIAKWNSGSNNPELSPPQINIIEMNWALIHTYTYTHAHTHTLHAVDTVMRVKEHKTVNREKKTPTEAVSADLNGGFLHGWKKEEVCLFAGKKEIVPCSISSVCVCVSVCRCDLTGECVFQRGRSSPRFPAPLPKNQFQLLLVSSLVHPFIFSSTSLHSLHLLSPKQKLRWHAPDLTVAGRRKSRCH